jgi:Na+/H+-translocating membrane pyrophosphatase
MGVDLFGSFCSVNLCCPCGFIISFFGTNKNFLAMSFPLIICAAGIFVCLLAALVAMNLFKL